MLTLQKADDTAIACSLPTDKSIEDLLNREWLLTNSRGGYASSTIVGCNTRGYHGLLIGSLNPPANRIMALANCLEMLVFKQDAFCDISQNGNQQRVFNLSTFEFSDKFAPQGFTYIKRFRQDIGVHFDYELDKVALTKSVYLLRDEDTVALVYDFTRVKEPADFVLRPFAGLRGFHSLQKSYAPLCSTWLGYGLLVRHDVPNSCEMFLSCPSANFEKDPQWWFNFVYRKDKERGQEFIEDLWTPGFFKCRIDTPTRVILWANLSIRYKPEQLINADIDEVCEDLNRHKNSIIVNAAAKNRDEKLRILYLAADRFITKRQTDHTVRTTVLAGFPWFADWGRDAFIALPGLLLSAGWS